MLAIQVVDALEVLAEIAEEVHTYEPKTFQVDVRRNDKLCEPLNERSSPGSFKPFGRIYLKDPSAPATLDHFCQGIF